MGLRQILGDDIVDSSDPEGDHSDEYEQIRQGNTLTNITSITLPEEEDNRLKTERKMGTSSRIQLVV